MKVTSFCLAIICSVFVIAPVWAHHSHGNYNLTTFLNFKGKVTEIHWMNPHTWIYLEVTDATGQTDVWALEGASVTQLTRKGWVKESIKTGDTISARCHPMHDGTKGCLAAFVSAPGLAEKAFD